MSLLSEFYSQVWAVQLEKLREIEAVVLRHDAGERLSAEQVQAIVAGRGEQPAQPQTHGYIGVLPLYGTIFPKANMVTENSGGTSLRRFAQGFRQFASDPNVKGIVIDVDSPGGAIGGVPEMAAEIRAARGQKPIVAVASTLMASAAYWIGSAADEIVATPSGDVGSIGVYYPHRDQSVAMEKAGEKVEFISAGEGKTDGHSAGPLSDKARARIQQRVDETYDMFVADVAAGRGVTPEVVRHEWKADVYSAREAQQLGMVNRIATLDETIARMAAVAPQKLKARGDAGEAERRLHAAKARGLLG